MTKFRLILPTCLFFIYTLPAFTQGIIYAEYESDYINKVKAWRQQKDENYKQEDKTMLTKELLKNFSGLNYYDIKYDYVVQGKLTKFNDGRTFSIKTTGGESYEYLIFGKVQFLIEGNQLELQVYQSQRSATAGKKKGALFIPYIDLTSGGETFGGGRYLVLDVPDNDTLPLDFNMAYNPYCVYDVGHSCPIPPRENRLNVRIEAGEKMYPL